MVREGAGFPVLIVPFMELKRVYHCVRTPSTMRLNRTFYGIETEGVDDDDTPF